MKKLLLLSILLFSCSNSKPVEYNNIDNIEDWNLSELVLFNNVNNYRKANGLNELKIDKLNWELALMRNMDNVAINNVSHTGYVKVIKTIHENGLNSSSEILGFRYLNANTMLDAWKRSESHNVKLLDPTWLYTGISVYTDENTGYRYYCQIFTR